MSDLDLRQPETILKGGKRGPAIVPGKAEQSLLYKAVAHTGDLQMPPGKPLPTDDPKVRQPDITRARALLRWEPKVPLEQGLVKTIEYFRTKLK